MFVPVLLLLISGLSAALVAYGTSAGWAQYPHGLDLILWSRRLQWPLLTLSILLSLWLIALVVAGRRRAWWLIGLGPLLALFIHHFVASIGSSLSIVDQPSFVTADNANFLSDSDYVVGLQFGDQTYAYPYESLFYHPVVFQTDHDKRMVLMWSAFANRAMAQTITREVKARDLEIVSMPANALLLYNRANGQFINALTGQTPSGQRPLGFGQPIVASTMTWKDWRALNPQTQVMSPLAPPRGGAAPHGPILPAYQMPPAILDCPPLTSIVLVGTTQPAAIRTDQVGPEPLHIQVDGQPAFAFREAADQPVKAFSCVIKKLDLFPHFKLDRTHKYAGAVFIDSDTGSGWSAAGAWVDGRRQFRQQLRGVRLAPVPVQDHLYWGVMKFWYPSLQLTAQNSVTSGS